MMTEVLNGLVSIMSFESLLWVLLGVTIGTLVGALPGLGPTTGIAMLLPLTFGLSPLNGLLLLMGIYQGAMYGGRISSILLNVPGDAAAVVSTFEGYPLTKKGKAGYALTVSAVSSFIGSMFGFLGMVFFSTIIAKMAIKFGAPEYFALMVFALVATGGMVGKHKLKGLISTVFGILIAMVGSDAIVGAPRMTFGLINLWDGVNFVAIAIGLFGLSEVFIRIEEGNINNSFKDKIPFRDLFPKAREIFGDFYAMIRGAFIGFIIGVLPGPGSTMATFLSYTTEKKLSKKPEKFGHGESKGLSGPESANNASVGGALITLFSLGIPGTATCAILLGALIMFGMQPGPMLLERSGDIVWGAIAGLGVANVLLIILNIFFVPAFAIAIQKIQPYLVPLISVLCFIGVYMVNYSFFDVGVMIVFGIFGYFLKKFNYPLAPLILGVILGPMIEKYLRQSMIMSQNNPLIFIQRPISAALLAVVVIILVYPLVKKIIAKTDKKDISA